MRRFLVKRLALMLVSLVLVSFISFVIIELPPGDYLTLYIKQLEMIGEKVDKAYVDGLKVQYGYNQPMLTRYFKWISNIVLHGDFGRSMVWKEPVVKLLAERLPYTIIFSLCTIIFSFLIAIPIGVFSATHQYTIGDYLATILAFIGLAIPAFLLALVSMYLLNNQFGISIGGIMSQQFVGKPFSFAKLLDMAGHLVMPVLISGLAGIAEYVRALRATLLDELNKDYVQTARVKGLSEFKLIMKYPVRVAINPLLSSMGKILPLVVSGSTIVSVVMSLPTVGPLLLSSLKSQDMYLAGGIVLLLTVLTLVGTFLSDIILAISDPRIRYE